MVTGGNKGENARECECTCYAVWKYWSTTNNSLGSLLASCSLMKDDSSDYRNEIVQTPAVKIV